MAIVLYVPFLRFTEGAGWLNELGSYLKTNTSLSPIRRGFAPGFVNYKKVCTRLAVASDKVSQLFAHGQWFSPGTPASSITKTGRHEIAEIFLKVALSTKNQSNQIKSSIYGFLYLQWFLYWYYCAWHKHLVCHQSTSLKHDIMITYLFLFLYIYILSIVKSERIESKLIKIYDRI